VGSDEVTTQPATAEIVGVTFVRPETSRIVYPRLLLPLKLRGAQAITTLLPKRGDRPRVTNTSMPPLTPIGFTGMIRDPTWTTVSGKIARNSVAVKLPTIPFFRQVSERIGLKSLFDDLNRLCALDNRESNVYHRFPSRVERLP
jgi:hypothetical protein